MPAYHIRPRAAQDLDDIRLYIAQDSPIAALNTMERFHEVFRRIAQFPMMGRARPELAAQLRSFPVGNYLIFYRPTSGGVDISRILHGSRDIEALFAQ